MYTWYESQARKPVVIDFTQIAWIIQRHHNRLLLEQLPETVVMFYLFEMYSLKRLTEQHHRYETLMRMSCSKHSVKNNAGMIVF